MSMRLTPTLDGSVVRAQPCVRTVARCQLLAPSRPASPTRFHASRNPRTVDSSGPERMLTMMLRLSFRANLFAT